MSKHQTREVRIFGLYRDDLRGEHFAIVRSGTWAEVTAYLSATVRYVGARSLFVAGADGSLRPLMA